MTSIQTLLVSIVLSLALLLTNTSTFLSQTPRGIQCPTATVQQVTEVTYVKDCCGKLVAVTKVRKPKEGEAGFKQCRCAEKKSAEKQEEAKSTETRPSVIMLPANSASVTLRLPLFNSSAIESLWAQVQRETPTFSPPTPPPQNT